ncbi:hypothetical protein [Kitasatospora purpeofusca]|uniref:hypothetical protein n=1 Tax=Kitasatospora purpeofusca TaxID=67352 RepID=UPI0036ADD543
MRTGATVAVTWDDNPDACISHSGSRPCTVTVAGDTNTAGPFATNPATSPGCRPMITDVRAAQTAPPLAALAIPSPGAADPCAGRAGQSASCATVGGNKETIEACPPTGRDCLDSVAGKGETENTGITTQTQAVQNFADTPRKQNPNAAAGLLCSIPNALTDNTRPGDALVPPDEWWYC